MCADDDDDDDDDGDAGDCLVVDSSDLSIKSYSLGTAPNSAIIDISWSLDTSRLVTVNADVRPTAFIHFTLITNCQKSKTRMPSNLRHDHP